MPRLLAVAGPLLFLAVTPVGHAQPGPAGPLDGTWTATSAEFLHDTPGVPDFRPRFDPKRPATLEIMDGRWVFKLSGRPIAEGTATLDNDRNPPRFTLTLKDVPGGPPVGGQRWLGVYRVQGDALKLGFVNSGDRHPDGFAPRPGEALALQTYARIRK